MKQLKAVDPILPLDIKVVYLKLNKTKVERARKAEYAAIPLVKHKGNSLNGDLLMSTHVYYAQEGSLYEVKTIKQDENIRTLVTQLIIIQILNRISGGDMIVLIATGVKYHFGHTRMSHVPIMTLDQLFLAIASFVQNKWPTFLNNLTVFRNCIVLFLSTI